MSKPRYWWYGNVCRTIGEYPKLQRRVRDMSGQKITPAYSSSPKGGASSGRAVEDIAVRVLSSQEYRDYEAVSRAIGTARTWRDGETVLAVVSAHAWGDRLRFDEIGRGMYMSTASAKRLHQRFVYEVARELGYKS
mgnify:CR=1 FL=1